MRLSSFRIKNYKSIKDTGDVQLSDLNNVFVLAGQNESGKSAILLALSDFENDHKKFDPESQQYSLKSSPKQYISCTYHIEDSDSFYLDVLNQISEDYNITFSEEEENTIATKLEAHCDFTLIKEQIDENVRFSIDDSTYKLISILIPSQTQPHLEGSTQPEEGVATPENQENPIEEEKMIPQEEIAEIFFRYCPAITIFGDFCSLLPDKILISELQEEKAEKDGYTAVRNLELILDIDFVQKEQQLENKRSALQDGDNKTLSINFQDDWHQKIYNTNEVKLEYNFQKRNGVGEDGSFVEFYVITKEGEKLYPHQRSQGLIWFLSLWLELKARSLEENGTILLLDEPDQHLHIKAQKDMLGLINKLAKDGNQILYSTHSPYLIDTENLSAIQLVYNTEQDGTLLEKLSSSKVDNTNKVDALKPISDAIGMGTDYLVNFNNDKCIILEGLSDFYYFSGMKLLLDPKGIYTFLPCTGVRKIPSLISFCFGYGKRWKVISDDGKAAKEIFDEVTTKFFDGDIALSEQKFLVLNGVNGIENMFEYADLKLINATVGEDKKNKEMVVGKKRKILFSSTFFEKVQKGEINERNLSQDTIQRFSNAFSFIKKKTK